MLNVMHSRDEMSLVIAKRLNKSHVSDNLVVIVNHVNGSNSAGLRFTFALAFLVRHLSRRSSTASHKMSKLPTLVTLSLRMCSLTKSQKMISFAMMTLNGSTLEVS